MLTNLRLQIETLGVWWCRMQHAAILWPIHGEYRCAECYRRYPVAWDEDAAPFGHDLGTVASRFSGAAPSILGVSDRNANEY